MMLLLTEPGLTCSVYLLESEQVCDGVQGKLQTAQQNR